MLGADCIIGYLLLAMLVYIGGAVLFAFIMLLPCYSSKYDEPEHMFVWPYLIFIFIRFLLNRLINKLKQTQMNFKILGKAMGYMFMPTLGVLLMLLIGFFDPLAMWNFIKSDNGWAVTVRIILFLAEIILIVVLYFTFLEEWEEEQKTIAKEKALKGEGKNPNIIADLTYRNEIRQLFKNVNDRDLYHQYKTESEDVMIIERKKYQA